MKKILGIILILCMLLSLLPVNTFAATMVSAFEISVMNEPEAGQKPTDYVLGGNASCDIVKVEWVGTFDANGCYMANSQYTVNVTLRLKEGMDKYIVDKEGRARINKKEAKMTSLSADGREAVISYTFSTGTSVEQAGASSEAVVLNEANFYIEKPVVGGKPATVITTDRSDVFDISNVRWSGDFDENGCFIGKNGYRVNFVIKVKDGVNMIISEESGVNGRKYYLNGDILSTGVVLDDGKVFSTGHNFTVAFSSKKLDTQVIYSKEEADSLNWESIPKLYVVKNKTEAHNLSNGFGPDGELAENITRVIVDTADEVQNTFMEDMPNLEEVWLSESVDPVAFIEQHADNGPAYQWLYAWETNAAKTWEFKLYVPESRLSEIKALFNGFARRPHRMRWFETVVYKGTDVYSAYEQKHSGVDVSIPWCTNHKYTLDITTADRVMIEKDCMHTRSFCYSCEICGKPEKNMNHLFSQDATIPPRALTDTLGRMDHFWGKSGSNNIKASNYVGINSEGEFVYQKVCLICGMNAYDCLTHKEFETYPNLNKVEAFGSLDFYQAEVNAFKQSWEPVYVPSTLVAKVGDGSDANDSVFGFAVKAPYVTAKFSAWAENEVNWAKEEGLLDDALLGSDYTWNINRLQFSSLAVKLAEKMLGDEITPAPSGTFTDTDDIYVRKAYAAGITSGTGNGQFSPYVTLNRQQMATFIYRALQYVRDNSGIRYTIYTPQLEKYADNWAIADWARTPMGFMNALGLVKGVSDDYISPDGSCTIEQAILVAYRSLFADEIGWYQMVPTHKNANSYSITRYVLTDQADTTGQTQTQASVSSGDRIWVTGIARYVVDETGFLETTHPYFPNRKAWVDGQFFKPIKDLSAEDLALYNQNK